MSATRIKVLGAAFALLAVLSQPAWATISVGCGHRFDDSYFHHSVKPAILSYVRENGINYRRLGKNPDIKCKKDELILEGTTRQGGKVNTGISFSEMLQALNLHPESNNSESKTESSE